MCLKRLGYMRTERVPIVDEKRHEWHWSQNSADRRMQVIGEVLTVDRTGLSFIGISKRRLSHYVGPGMIFMDSTGNEAKKEAG